MGRIFKIKLKFLLANVILATILFILYSSSSIKASSSSRELDNSEIKQPISNTKINSYTTQNTSDIKPEPVKLTNLNQIASVNSNKQISDRLRRHYSSTVENHFGPKLVHQPQSVLVPPHKPHTVECPVESNPKPEVKWFKDDQLLMSQPTHLEQTGTELMFFQMNDEDSGQYHCEATNYLGSISSEPFKLTVQSSVQDPRVRLEPNFPLAGVDQQVEFTCSFQASNKISARQQRRPDIGWRRNGRKLPVKWLTSDQDFDGQGTGSDIRSRYVARQVTNANVLPADVTMFALTITKTQLKDDNATFACLVGASLIDGENVSNEELARESNQIKLRVFNQEQREGETALVNMKTSLAPPIDDLLSRDVQHLIPEAKQRGDSSLAKQNYTTTQLSPDHPPSTITATTTTTTTRRVSTLKETLLDLYEISKPTILGFAVLLLITIIILAQWAYIRRKNQLENRYIKHHTYSNSSGSGGSGVSSAINAIDCGDSHHIVDSLINRTISAQSAMSLSGNNNGLTVGKKYRSYRDQLRKVAAVNDNAADLVVGGTGDLVNVNGYLLAASQAKQNKNNNNNCQPNENNNEPFFMSSELPNLYNQSLAAREQARSLLQASEHMRSLGNLQIAGQKQHQQQHKFYHQVASALQRFNGANQNGSHLNLPLSFTFNDEAESQNGSANNGRSNEQYLHKRPSEGPSQLVASALWQPQVEQQFRQQQHFNHQIRGQQVNENYQLVNCSSVSPGSSSSSESSSKSSSQGRAVSTARTIDLNQLRLQQNASNHPNIKELNSSLNHYSTIGMNDDDDGDDESRYEEVDAGSQKRSSVHQKPSDHHHQDSFRANKISTFVRDNSNRSDRSNHKSLRSSIMSNSSTSGCGDIITTNSAIRSTDVNPPNRFNSRRDKRQQQEIKNPISNYQIDKTNRSRYQDQLSPYAVSSICGSVSANQELPMNSEAMRALNEQFDINHLLLAESSERNSPTLPFEALPLPPPPPSEVDQ